VGKGPLGSVLGLASEAKDAKNGEGVLAHLLLFHQLHFRLIL